MKPRLFQTRYHKIHGHYLRMAVNYNGKKFYSKLKYSGNLQQNFNPRKCSYCSKLPQYFYNIGCCRHWQKLAADIFRLSSSSADVDRDRRPPVRLQDRRSGTRGARTEVQSVQLQAQSHHRLVQEGQQICYR